MSIPLYQHLKQLLNQDLTVAVATIVSVKGSVPREVGAKMIVHPLGRHAGTIGGGCGEADVIRAGLDVIQDGAARTVHVDLTDAISMESLGVCGGVMAVFIEPWRPDDATQRKLLDALLQTAGARRSLALTTVISAEDASWIARRALLIGEETKPVGNLNLHLCDAEALREVGAALAARDHRLVDTKCADAQLTLFAEVWAQPPHLIIAGAGHIAVPLAEIAKINEFAVSVIDDRAQFAHPSRFPTADRVIAGPFRQELQALRGQRAAFDRHTYLVLVTRGHQHDIDCLLEVLDDPVAYIGMIGSRRRIRAVFDLLAGDRGIAPEKFDRIYAPVGLDIGARTPAEIAVSIMAEIINVQRSGRATSMSEQIRRERRARSEDVTG